MGNVWLEVGIVLWFLVVTTNAVPCGPTYSSCSIDFSCGGVDVFYDSLLFDDVVFDLTAGVMCSQFCLFFCFVFFFFSLFSGLFPSSLSSFSDDETT